MARVAGQQRGIYTARQMVRAWNFAGAGQSTRIPLDKVQCRINGMVACVLEFLVVLPSATLSAPGAPVVSPTNYVDGVGFGELFGRVNLSASDVSPFSQTDGGAFVVRNADWRGLSQPLAFMSGKPVFETQSSERRTVETTPAGPLGGALAAAGFAETHNYRRPAEMGPFAIIDALGVATTSINRPVLRIPVGRSRYEDSGENPIPAAYFSGQGLGKGCVSGGAGELEIVAGSTCQTDTISWGNEGVDVYVLYKLVPDSKIPVPVKPYIYQTRNSDSRFLTPNGMAAWVSFERELSAGAMQAPDYTTVQVLDPDGNIVVANTLSELYARQATMQHGGEGDGFPAFFPNWGGSGAAQVGNGPRGLQRFRGGFELIVERGSLLTMPGGDDAGLLIDVQVSGLTTHDLVYGGFQPVGARGLALHEALYPRPGSTILPDTKNGSEPADTSESSALPAKQYSPKAQ